MRYLMIDDKFLPIDITNIECKNYIILDCWEDSDSVSTIVLFYMESYNSYSLKALVGRIDDTNFSCEASYLINTRLSGYPEVLKGLEIALKGILLPGQLEIPYSVLPTVSEILNLLNIQYWFEISHPLTEEDEESLIFNLEDSDIVASLPFRPEEITLNLHYMNSLTTQPSDYTQIILEDRIISLPKKLIDEQHKFISITPGSEPFTTKVLDCWNEGNEKIYVILISWVESTYCLDTIILTVDGPDKGLIEPQLKSTVLIERLVNNSMTSFKFLRWCIKHIEFPCLLSLPEEMNSNLQRLMEELGRDYKKASSNEDFMWNFNIPRFFINSKSRNIIYKLLPIESNTVIQLYQMDNI